MQLIFSRTNSDCVSIVLFKIRERTTSDSEAEEMGN